MLTESKQMSNELPGVDAIDIPLSLIGRAILML
jgi:hypothetical protein